MVAPRGRGRLNGFEQLPAECDPIIAQASNALRDREKSQLEIYQDFVDACQQLMVESHGELEFQIPSKSAFNRYSIRLAVMTRRLEETREIAGTIAERFDAEASDDLTLIAAEAIKTLVWEVLTAAGEHGIDPKGAMALANALRSAVQAQGMSTARKQKIDAEFAQKATKAVNDVAKVKGITQEGAQEILAKILNVRTS
jgi:PHD/YefM family antitoxin component YafN of YafNO toxin-antitoxin module